jgi:serine/threonine protein phosphatase 1
LLYPIENLEAEVFGIGMWKKSSGQTKRERTRITLTERPETIYAVGDVHGCLDLLLQLEQIIEHDAAGRKGEKLIVYLGDYIDKGPSSAAVIDHLLSSELTHSKRLCLAGNHEEMMLSFLQKPTPRHAWLSSGGINTLESYGLDWKKCGSRAFGHQLHGMIPSEHLDFIKSLPAILAVPEYRFSHAGYNANVHFDEQNDNDLLWSRPRPTVDATTDFKIVHGHTPTERINLSGHTISVDTHAYSSGKLSCLRLTLGDAPEVLETQARSSRPPDLTNRSTSI